MRFSSDPRVRQTINQISDSLESANQRTQTTLFTLSETYIQPCLAALHPCFVSCQTCLEASCQPCCQARDDIRRNRPPRYSRCGRERAVFDFYDDWDQEEEEWGNDELDRLLAGDESAQPGRRGGMSYGTRNGPRGMASAKDGLDDDPTLVPQSSIFGFLERLPWKIGGRGTRYKPSPSNLQTNVGKRGMEAEPLLEDDERVAGKHKRQRRSTNASRDTANSLSSRGDIFPSDDEDDAREIDDEYALALGRRTTGATSDETSGSRRQRSSRTSSKTTSSSGTKSPNDGRLASPTVSDHVPLVGSPSEMKVPTMADLKLQEDEARFLEERDIQDKREAARKLALDRGLDQADHTTRQVSDLSGVDEAMGSPTLDSQPEHSVAQPQATQSKPPSHDVGHEDFPANSQSKPA